MRSYFYSFITTIDGERESSGYGITKAEEYNEALNSTRRKLQESEYRQPNEIIEIVSFNNVE